MTNKFKIFAGSDGTEQTSEEKTVEKETSEAQEPEKKVAKEEKSSSMTDNEAKLLKDVMKKKEQLAEAQGKINELSKSLDAINALGGLEKLSAMIHAEEAKQKEELEKKGEWEKLKKQMSEDHTKAMAEIQKQLQESTKLYQDSQKKIIELTLGAQFNSSKFIAEELTLPPSKARVVYEQYFDLVDGKVVGYDKPRGQEGRTPLVDQFSNNLSFDEAMKKIVEADPDSESLLRSKVKSGSGSQPSNKSIKPENTTTLTGLEMISAGLRKLK